MAEGQNVCSENKEIRETMRQMRVVNKGIRKVDAKALVTGRAYIQMISHLQTA